MHSQSAFACTLTRHILALEKNHPLYVPTFLQACMSMLSCWMMTMRELLRHSRCLPTWRLLRWEWGLVQERGRCLLLPLPWRYTFEATQC